MRNAEKYDLDEGVQGLYFYVLSESELMVDYVEKF